MPGTMLRNGKTIVVAVVYENAGEGFEGYKCYPLGKEAKRFCKREWYNQINSLRM